MQKKKREWNEERVNNSINVLVWCFPYDRKTVKIAERKNAETRERLENQILLGIIESWVCITLKRRC